MTASPVGERAARTLTAELARHTGATTGLVVGVDADSAVLAAAIDALLPGDTLTVVPVIARAALRAHRRSRGAGSPTGSGSSRVARRGRRRAGRGHRNPVDRHGRRGARAGRRAGEVPRRRRGALRRDAGVRPAARPRSSTGRTRCSGSAPIWCSPTGRRCACTGCGSPPRPRRWRRRLAPAYRPSSVPLTRGMHIDSNGVAAAGIALGAAALLRMARPSSKLWLVPALAAAAGGRVLPRPGARRAHRGVRGRGGVRRQGALRGAAARRALRRRRVPARRGLPVRAGRARQPLAGRRQGGRLLRGRRRLRGGDEAGRRAQRGRVHGAGDRPRHGGRRPADRA